jgi:hypothetical protein
MRDVRSGGLGFRMGLPRRLERKLRSRSRRTQRGCLLWTGQVDPKGSARLWWQGRNRSARRLAFAVAHGPIPPGMKILTRCRLQRCIEPRHLYCASQATLTALIKRPRGEANGNHKLTVGEVRAIRSAQATQRRLAKRFRVSVRTVSLIRQHRAWAHIP